MANNIDESSARAIFQAAINENRCAELWDCLTKREGQQNPVVKAMYKASLGRMKPQRRWYQPDLPFGRRPVSTSGPDLDHREPSKG